MLERIPPGAHFRVLHINDPETAQFAHLMSDFLVSEGRHLDAFVVAITGSGYGQDIRKEGDVYQIQVGADNGVRGP